jgi:PPIC-type PPIASE domain
VRTLAAVTLVVLGACGGKKPAHAPAPASHAAREHWTGTLAPRPSAEAVAVAEVNGDTIWDVDVARHAGARHLDARAALDELIELQLLAQEAERRDLADDPEVVEARQQARTRALLRLDFEPGYKRPEDVPQADLDTAWSNPRIYLRFNHPLYHQVRFLRVEAGKDATAAQIEDARQKAEAIRAAVAAAHPASKEEFAQVASEKATELGAKFAVSDHNATERGTVKVFLDAAMALHQPGDLSPVTRTDWGWDLLYLYNVIPEVHKSQEQAAPELRTLIFDESRRRAFLGWTDRLVHSAHVVRHDELLREDQTTP